MNIEIENLKFKRVSNSESIHGERLKIKSKRNESEEVV